MQTRQVNWSDLSDLGIFIQFHSGRAKTLQVHDTEMSSNAQNLLLNIYIYTLIIEDHSEGKNFIRNHAYMNFEVIS